MRRGCLLILMLIAGIESGLAQSSLPPAFREWEATMFGGVSSINSVDFATTVIGNAAPSRIVGIDYASGYQVGLQCKNNIDDYWSTDLEYRFSNQPMTITNLSPQIRRLPLSQSVNQFTYGGSVKPDWGRFEPYGKFGLGTSLYFIHGNSKTVASETGINLRDSWKFAFYYGGGFKYVISNDAGITFDFRDQVTGVPSYGIPSRASVINGRYQPGLTRDGLLHNLEFNVGLVIRFDEEY